MCAVTFILWLQRAELRSRWILSELSTLQKLCANLALCFSAKCQVLTSTLFKKNWDYLGLQDELVFFLRIIMC